MQKYGVKVLKKILLKLIINKYLEEFDSQNLSTFV